MEEKIYTIKHETTGEQVEIHAFSIDSETHKYQWTFWRFDKQMQRVICCIYSQRFNIIDIQNKEK